MGKVAAIQMTSSHVVAENLIAAGQLLREAKDAGADIACLPENFAFIGLRDVDKQQTAETDLPAPSCPSAGAGPPSAAHADTATTSKTTAHKIDRDLKAPPKLRIQEVTI